MSKQTSLAGFFKSTKKEIIKEELPITPSVTVVKETVEKMHTELHPDSMHEEESLDSQLSNKLNISYSEQKAAASEKSSANKVQQQKESAKFVFVSEPKQEEPKGERHPKSTGDIPQFDDFVHGLCSWEESLKKTTSQKYFKDLYNKLRTEYRTKVVFPPPDLIFNAFRLTPINKIKVVIVGQDPYFKAGQAMGLSFSVPSGEGVPSSLNNVYNSIQKDPLITNFKRTKTGDLTSWAKQGVFLMNAVLTVEEGKADSHKKIGWSNFTDEVISIINRECDNIVFLAWGKNAQVKCQGVNKTKHLLLETSHPSGLSFTKGFSEAFHFSKVNKYLREHGKEEIDWNVSS